MKWTKILLSTLIFCLFFSFLSCEKPDFGLIGDDPIDVPEGFATLTFNITHFEQIPFDGNVDYSRATDAGNVCTRINLAVFNDEGKVGTINQTIGDEDFGRISVAVPEGDCKIVILAHSGTGNATISKPDSIRFANNKVTDTFYYYAEMTADGESSHDVRLRRAVAKFQLATEDNVPENVAEIVFKYTGGSSAFDAKTGLGKINSRQTETRPVTAEMKGRPAEFDIYTFPHEQEDELKITMTVNDADGKALFEKVFDKVPVKINQITRCKGIVFNNENNYITLRLQVDDEWTQKDYQF